MRYSDIYFFGVIFIMLILTTVCIATNYDPPVWTQFWWVLFLPYVVIRLFYRNSKLFKWLDKERLNMEGKENIGNVVKCKKSLYKSTYKCNAFTKGNKYTIESIDKHYWIYDNEGRAFTFTDKQAFGLYRLEDYFEGF